MKVFYTDGEGWMYSDFSSPGKALRIANEIIMNQPEHGKIDNYGKWNTVIDASEASDIDMLHVEHTIRTERLTTSEHIQRESD